MAALEGFKYKQLLYVGAIALAVYVLYRISKSTPQPVTATGTTSQSGVPQYQSAPQTSPYLSVPLSSPGLTPNPAADVIGTPAFNVGGNSFGGLNFGGSPVTVIDPTTTNNGSGGCGCNECSQGACSSANATFPDGRGTCMSPTQAQQLIDSGDAQSVFPQPSSNPFIRLMQNIAQTLPPDPSALYAQIFSNQGLGSTGDLTPPVGVLSYY